MHILSRLLFLSGLLESVLWRHGKRKRRSIFPVFIGAVAAVCVMLMAGAPASAATIPRNPDRAVLPVIAGSKVETPAGSCTVGAVLVPRSILSRVTPYQRATRWIVIAKHCAPLYATIHVGTRALGTVSWQSEGSDIELVRVSPAADGNALRCAPQHSNPSFCSPVRTYTPLANGQAFNRSGGVIRRVPIAGSASPGTERFCTSGWASGLQCVWNRISMPRGISTPHHHLVAADADESTNLDFGDSGGPVLSYSNQLLGIISGNLPHSTIMLYTPIDQVLTELFSYQLAPSS